MLKKWNIDFFGNIFANIKTFEGNVQAAQVAFDDVPSQANWEALDACTSSLSKFYTREEIFWSQKVRV